MTRADYLAEQGASLRRQRSELGLTRAAVADGIGASETAVALWEEGRSVMSAYNALLLRKYFKRMWHEKSRSQKPGTAGNAAEASA